MTENSENNIERSLPEEACCSSEKELTPSDPEATEDAQQFSFDSLKPKIKPIWKVLFSIFLLACIGTSLYFSFSALSLDMYEYDETGDGYRLSGFHNDGSIKEITIDYVMVKKGIRWEKDVDKPVASIREFALCCDNDVQVINIGKSVTFIEDEAFYSCKNLRTINVDPDNPAYTSLDGVLYTKDMSEIVLFPICYAYRDKDTISDEEKEKTSLVSYELPSTVKKLSPLCFAYAERLSEVILPEGVEELGTLSFFKCSSLEKLTLPGTIRSIGSDCFSYCKKLTYMYIPASVTEIGHHAFYECAGLKELYAERDESSFRELSLGDYWKNTTLTNSLLIRYGQRRA